MEKDILHDHDMFFANESHTIYCQRCKNAIRAGSYWILFCPCCNITQKNFLVSNVMSCIHCEMPLDVKYSKESKQEYGRCSNPKCGDCYSMQDLCLVPLGRTIGEDSCTPPLKKILDSLPDKEEPKKSEQTPPKAAWSFVQISPTTTATNWDFPTSRGRKIPRKPNLDDLDRM